VPTIRLYDTFGGTWHHNTDPSAVEVSANFTPLADGTCTELSWYRGSTTSALKPDRLRLYDRAAGAIVAEVTSVPDSGAIGWQRTAISSVSIVANRIYQVAAHFPAGGGFVDSPAYNSNLPTYPVTWASIGRRSFNYTGLVISGETSNNTSNYAVDVLLDVGPAPEPPDPGPVVAAELDNWLSTDPEVQTHEADGLPWLTKVVADVTKNAVDATKIVVDATKDIVDLIPTKDDADWTAIKKLWQIAGVLTDAEIALWNLHAQRAPTQLTGTTPGGGSAFYSGDGRQVAQTAADLQDQVSALAGQVSQLAGNVEQLQAPLAGFPTDFELVDEFTFVECVAWNVAADVYVIHVSTPPRGMAYSAVCGISSLPRAGWWSPLADTIPGEQHYINFEFHLVSHPAGRLPGILVQLGHEGEGTVQAWNRLPPPIGP
jgi:hypothetical protein